MIHRLGMPPSPILVHLVATGKGGGGCVGDVFPLVLFSRVRLFCDPMDCSPPGSSVHGISQTRILEWVAISSSKGSSPPRDSTHVSCIGRRILFTAEPSGKPCLLARFCFFLRTWRPCLQNSHPKKRREALPQNLVLGPIRGRY